MIAMRVVGGDLYTVAIGGGAIDGHGMEMPQAGDEIHVETYGGGTERRTIVAARFYPATATQVLPRMDCDVTPPLSKPPDLGSLLSVSRPQARCAYGVLAKPTPECAHDKSVDQMRAMARDLWVSGKVPRGHAGVIVRCCDSTDVNRMEWSFPVSELGGYEAHPEHYSAEQPTTRVNYVALVPVEKGQAVHDGQVRPISDEKKRTAGEVIDAMLGYSGRPDPTPSPYYIAARIQAMLVAAGYGPPPEDEPTPLDLAVTALRAEVERDKLSTGDLRARRAALAGEMARVRKHEHELTLRINAVTDVLGDGDDYGVWQDDCDDDCGCD